MDANRDDKFVPVLRCRNKGIYTSNSSELGQRVTIKAYLPLFRRSLGSESTIKAYTSISSELGQRVAKSVASARAFLHNGKVFVYKQNWSLTTS